MLSIIVPCYNEEEAIPIFCEKIKEVKKNKIDESIEIVFVNDGSSDKTEDVLKNYAEQYKWIKYISFSRNFGKESAMMAGMEHTKLSEYVAIMDVDLQDPPDLIPEMLKDIKENKYDSVATRRVTRKGEPPIRSFFARMFYKLINKMSDIEIVDGARDFRIMTRQMTDSVLELCEYNRFSKGIFSWVGYNTKWIEYENVERSAGETKWSFNKLFLYALDGIVAFTIAPLKISSIVGIFVSIISFLFLIFIICRKLIFGDPVDGWTSTVCIITLFSGFQFLFMGIIGEYIAKTYLETKKRPNYIIKNKCI